MRLIVRDEAVAALDELERRLALAHAAVARDEHALAEHLDEHAVLRQPRGEIARERGDEVGHELRRVLAHEKEVAVVLFGHLQALGKRIHAVADDETDDVVAHELLKAFAPLVGGQRLEIRALDAADDLHPLGVEVVVKPGELQPRAVDVGGADLARGVVLGRVQDGQPLLGSDLLQRDGIMRCAHRARLLSGKAAGAAAKLFCPGGAPAPPLPIVPKAAAFGNGFCSVPGIFSGRGTENAQKM